MKLVVPEPSLVLMVAPSGAGKSTFAKTHFRPTEVLSSDALRGWVSDDETNQEASADAFAVLNTIADRRLARGLLTVIDATNVQADSRKPLVALARKHHVYVVAIVLDVDVDVCVERNKSRPDRSFGARVVRGQHERMRQSLRKLDDEGVRYVYRLEGPEAIASAEVVRERLRCDLRAMSGPFDVIGDVHGCADELVELIEQLGYEVKGQGLDAVVEPHSEGRTLVFLGDLVDRGPRVADTLALVMNSVQAQTALCVQGNHEAKLRKKLSGREVTVSHGLARTLDELAALPSEFTERVKTFIDGLSTHYVLAGGRLTVAHAGLRQEMQGRASRAVRDFALYGETRGETDEFGLPVRFDWAANYRGKSLVAYGHTPVERAEFRNETICVDTGCVYGGALSALRFPEREVRSVPAKRAYVEAHRPIAKSMASGAASSLEARFRLDLTALIGGITAETEVVRRVTVSPSLVAPAIEHVSRFAVDPRWLVYVPPTMSPVETSAVEGYLERPEQALEYFAKQGVERVVLEEKHMGSRALTLIARDRASMHERFGHSNAHAGVIYTRNGRAFFRSEATEAHLVDALRDAAERAGLFDALSSRWLLWDTEILPWSEKAKELLRLQYAPTGSAGIGHVSAVLRSLDEALARGVPVSELRARTALRQEMLVDYVAAYQRYCWTVAGPSDLRVAPFHLLASEGAAHVGRDHGWHLQQCDALCEARPDALTRTGRLIVALADAAQRAQAVQWWLDRTEAGAEGCVVKPWDFIARGAKGIVQPALKVRGREYLRIIYGPEYTAPENLQRLRARGTSAKRSLAMREFSLGVEGLRRLARNESLARVHACAVATLALECEPVDPRL
ncbi:MAG: polynucleotide kinase-phosphatase [Polyangiales bacterium]